MAEFYNGWEENEVWVNLERFPKHQISTFGRIRNKCSGHILKPFLDRYGYLRVSIGNTDNVYIHRLMCETFYGAPKFDRAQVNHIDCDRKNNHIFNLEWCSAKDNIKWACEHGKLDYKKGLKMAVKANVKPVRIIELDKTFSSVKDCAKFLHINPNRVSRCLIGSRKGQSIHGYHIEYAEAE